MKQTIFLLIFVILVGCNQSNSKKFKNVSETLKNQFSDTTIIDSINIAKQDQTNESMIEAYRKQSLSDFKKATLYKLKDTLMVDLNGDGFLDKAFYKKENETSGIIIKHGQTNQEFRIGFGKSFSIWTDEFDCNWVDYWGLVEDRETTENTFTKDGDILGSNDVNLQNPSIVLGKDEVGGGLITFMNGQYVWIHQTD